MGVLALALCQGTGLVSRLIRLQTWGDYSHVAQVARFGDVRPMLPDVDPRSGQAWRFADDALVLLESLEPQGVQCTRTLEEAHAHYAAEGGRLDLFTVEASPAQVFEVLAWWAQRIALRRGYDFVGILRFLARRGAGDADERWVCSEAAFTALRDAGLVLLRCEPPRVSPSVLGFSPLLAGPFPLGDVRQVLGLPRVAAVAPPAAPSAAPPAAPAVRLLSRL